MDSKIVSMHINIIENGSVPIHKKCNKKLIYK
jgi:hypothetical protein